MGRVPDGASNIESLQLPSPGSLNPTKPVINPLPAELTLVEMGSQWSYHQDAAAPPATECNTGVSTSTNPCPESVWRIEWMMRVRLSILASTPSL